MLPQRNTQETDRDCSVGSETVKAWLHALWRTCSENTVGIMADWGRHIGRPVWRSQRFSFRQNWRSVSGEPSAH